ncbi:hypothetical protein ACS0TY_007258 [Phlomoides rotata]
MRSIRRRKSIEFWLLKSIMLQTVVVLAVAVVIILMSQRGLVRNRNRRRLDKIPDQIRNMSDLTMVLAHGWQWSWWGADAEKCKATRGRRTWSKMEEDALIQCLDEIVNDGWKADNGFRAGFQRDLEKGMHKLLSGIDILATPYINSQIHVWKKEYCMLSDLLSKSGIGWDSSTNTTDVVDEAM